LSQCPAGSRRRIAIAPVESPILCDRVCIFPSSSSSSTFSQFIYTRPCRHQSSGHYLPVMPHGPSLVFSVEALLILATRLSRAGEFPKRDSAGLHSPRQQQATITQKTQFWPCDSFVAGRLLRLSVPRSCSSLTGLLSLASGFSFFHLTLSPVFVVGQVQ
jgi:hypothetical protein